MLTGNRMDTNGLHQTSPQGGAGHRTVFALLSFLIATVLWAAPAEAEPKAIASGVSVATHGSETRFQLELDKAINFSVFALADPYRVIIDLPEIVFDLPPRAGSESTGLIKAYRYGLFSPGRSRIVIDTAGPVALANPEIYEPVDGQRARLVVSVEPTSREIFLRDFALNGSSRQGSVAVQPPPDPVVLRDEEPNAKPVIVIDPGHGGVDPGAVGSTGVREKDIVLTFSQDLAERLRKTGLYKVLMTRSTDRFIKLDDRSRFARQQRADLFISVHADSLRRGGKVRGATVYTLSEKASDAEAAALAANENKADLIAGEELEHVPDAVSDILFDLTRRETKVRSIDFAKTLVKSMRNKVRLNRNPHRHAGFVVLKAQDVPSVLLELGYLSNRQDEREMRSATWRRKAVDSILDATRTFFSVQLAGR